MSLLPTLFVSYLQQTQLLEHELNILSQCPDLVEFFEGNQIGLDFQPEILDGQLHLVANETFQSRFLTDWLIIFHPVLSHQYERVVVGLLSEMGFVNDTVPEYRGHMTFKIDKGTDYISVDANFKKDIDLAVEFTEIIYKQIYKTKGSKLVVKVE